MPSSYRKNAKMLTRGDLSITYSCKRSNIGKWLDKFQPAWKILLLEGLNVNEFNPAPQFKQLTLVFCTIILVFLLTSIWLILFNKYCVSTVDAFNAPKID